MKHMFYWLAVLFLGLAIVSDSYAEDSSSVFQINILPTISISVSDVNIAATTNNISVGTSAIEVFSNNQTGYTTTINTYLPSTSDYATDLKHKTANEVIPSILSPVAKSSFPINRWGISLNDETYQPLPASDQTGISINSLSSNLPVTLNTDVYFGVKIDESKMSGDYETAILVTLIANPLPYVPTISTMQEMTPDICAEMPLEEQIQLTDNRDGKKYWVAKLADGKCWMTQNLDLNLDVNTKLTPGNTDLNSAEAIANGGWTPARSTIDVTSNMTTTGTSATITGWSIDYNTPYSIDPGNVYFDGTYYSSSECNYFTTNCEHFKNTKQTLNNEHGHVGNYYNWSAVVASNDTSSFTTQNADYEDSICPKGWRLPHENDSSSGNDFETLITAYGNIDFSDQTLLNTPLFFVRAGYVGLGSLDYAAGYGFYWSSTVDSSSNARNLYFGSGVVNPSYNFYRNYGFSARCVAR